MNKKSRNLFLTQVVFVKKNSLKSGYNPAFSAMNTFTFFFMFDATRGRDLMPQKPDGIFSIC